MSGKTQPSSHSFHHISPTSTSARRQLISRKQQGTREWPGAVRQTTATEVTAALGQGTESRRQACESGLFARTEMAPGSGCSLMASRELR